MAKKKEYKEQSNLTIQQRKRILKLQQRYAEEPEENEKVNLKGEIKRIRFKGRERGLQRAEYRQSFAGKMMKRLKPRSKEERHKVTFRDSAKSRILKSFAGIQTQRSASGRTVGRPALVYKHISPFTGRPIPAPQYYKEKRHYDAIQRRRYEQMAARNPQPQQLTQFKYQQQEMPQNQSLPQRIMQQVRQLAPQPQSAQPQAYNRPIMQRQQVQTPQSQFQVETDIMTGRKYLKPVKMRERWTTGGNW